MTETTSHLAHLPTARPPGRPFDPPAELAAIRARQPLMRMTYPDGHEGWLATGYEVVRAVLADRRFSSRYELMHLPMPGAPPGALPPAPVGDLTGIDAPEHTRYRKLLAGYFTARRMTLLTGWVWEITADHLAAMQRHGPPVDLVTAYATPIPALVICELLGVPADDRDTFQHHARTMTSMDSMIEEHGTSIAALHGYLLDRVRAARAAPRDDLLSALTATDLDDDELAGIGAFLLAAGLDTTANMLALGTFALLRHPDQLAVLRAGGPQLIGPAIEELLRYLTVAHTGLRAALTDVELAGRTVRAGESVTLAMGAANRDPLRFPDPDRLDLGREPRGHLTLGHGIHLCLGAQLARVEMRVALPALITRFPGLRLDCAPEEVPMRTNSTIYGVHRLPAAW